MNMILPTVQDDADLLVRFYNIVIFKLFIFRGLCFIIITEDNFYLIKLYHLQN